MFKESATDFRKGKNPEIDPTPAPMLNDRTNSHLGSTKSDFAKKLAAITPLRKLSKDADSNGNRIHSVKRLQEFSPKNAAGFGTNLQHPNIRKITFEQIERFERRNSKRDDQKSENESVMIGNGDSSRLIPSASIFRKDSCSSITYDGFLRKDSIKEFDYSPNVSQRNISTDEIKIDTLRPSQSMKIIPSLKANSTASGSFVQLLRKTFSTKMLDRTTEEMSSTFMGQSSISSREKSVNDDLPRLQKVVVPKSSFIRYPSSPREEKIMQRDLSHENQHPAKQKKRFFAKSTRVSPDTSMISNTVNNSRDLLFNRTLSTTKGWK